jgi:uncharacterized membrane protein
MDRLRLGEEEAEMINLLLFLTSSIAVVVGVAFAMGLAWIAVTIPVLISAAAGYGLFSLSRRRTRGVNKRRNERSENAHRMRA